MSGKHNVVERVNTYGNLNTGMSISRTGTSDEMVDWPSDNLILNCSSWLNADPGFEDADGFEAKLTVGEGNIFRGCIAAYNADDGWDLFARETRIGVVTIEDCVAFKNGWVLDEDGSEVDAGNGNGFKMGGGNYPGGHEIKNSVSFANKANGITCNSCPDIKIYDCTVFGNGTANVTLYTNIASLDTDFAVTGLISLGGGKADNVAPQGTQSKEAYLNDTVHYCGNISGEDVDESWFKSLDVDFAVAHGVTRNADGSISLAGLLELTDKAPEDAGARLPGEQGQNFRDIIPSAWYFANVMDLHKDGILVGLDESTFAPNASVTRAQTAIVLYRLAGEKTAASAGYKDVKDTDWFAPAVNWAKEAGVMNGDGKTFGAGKSITRQDLITAIARYAGVETADESVLEAFPDAVDIANYARTAMAWAVEKGIISGNAAGSLVPTGTATRAEFAKIIEVFVSLEKAEA